MISECSEADNLEIMELTPDILQIIDEQPLPSDQKSSRAQEEGDISKEVQAAIVVETPNIS